MAILITLPLSMGPCIGPLLGGWIGERAGWRWICTFLLALSIIILILRLDWVLFIFAGCCFLLTLFLPETLAPVILRKKAAKLRKETGDSKYMTLEEAEKRPLGEVFKTALLRPIVLFFTEVIVILFSFCEFKFKLRREAEHLIPTCRSGLCLQSAISPVLCYAHCLFRDSRLQ